MSNDDTEVEVPFGDNAGETAVLLLAAAEESDLDPSVVRTGTGVFFVPKSLADKAGVATSDDDSDDSKPAAKKTAAKKAAE